MTSLWVRVSWGNLSNMFFLDWQQSMYEAELGNSMHELIQKSWGGNNAMHHLPSDTFPHNSYGNSDFFYHSRTCFVSRLSIGHRVVVNLVETLKISITDFTIQIRDNQNELGSLSLQNHPDTFIPASLL